MNRAIITEGQSLVDVAVQEYGSVEALFDLADAGGLGITDLLSPGQVLAVPDSLAARPELVAYFSGRGQRINTGDKPSTQPAFYRHDFNYPDFDRTDFNAAAPII